MTYKPVYFDNAASSFPKPPEVTDAVAHHLATNTSNPGRSGHFMSAAASDEVFCARTEIASFFRCLPEQVVFTQNATHAINQLLFGLLKKGDRVLISDREHNAVLRPLVALSEQGVSFDVVETNEDEPDEVRFERKITKNTRLIFCTHASNVTGRVFDIAALAKTAHRHGLLFATDASQTAGHTDIDTALSEIDFLCAAGHKGLFGIQGTGFLLCRNDTPLRPLIYGGNGVRSLESDMGQTMPERLEAGTLNTPAVISLKAGIRFLKRQGNALPDKERRLMKRLLEILQNDSRVTLYDNPTGQIPVVSFTLKETPSETVVARLSDSGICSRGGFHCAKLTHLALHTDRLGTVRLSPGFFNTENDTENFAKILEKI